MTDTAKVMNGEVTVGDHVAYATRSGSMSYMSIGEVTEVLEREPYPGKRVPVLRVNVTQSTHYGATPRGVIIGVLDRVVKL